MNERIYSEVRSFLLLSLVSFLSHNYQMCLLWNFLVKFQICYYKFCTGQKCAQLFCRFPKYFDALHEMTSLIIAFLSKIICLPHAMLDIYILSFIPTYICRISSWHMWKTLTLSYFLLALLLKLPQTEKLTSYWKLVKSERLKWQLLLHPWLEFSLMHLHNDDCISFTVDLQHEIRVLSHLQEIQYCSFGSAPFQCWHISYFSVKYWTTLFLSISLFYRANTNICIHAHINICVWN